MEKKKFKSGGKPNGNQKRAILRAANRSFQQRMKTKTRQFKRERTKQLPGMPQGIHLKNFEDCQCGRCRNTRSGEYVKSGP